MVTQSTNQIWAAAFDGAKNLTQLTIQDNIQIIHGYAFENAGLISLDIPDTVTELECAGLFAGCTDLTQGSLPSTLTGLNQYMFKNCQSLQSVDFSRYKHLSHLGMYAFQGCDSISSLVLPNGLTTLDTFDLRGMKNLSRVYIPASVINFPVDDLGAYNFLEGSSSDLIVYVVKGSTGEQWKTVRENALGLRIETVPAGTNPHNIDMGTFSLVDMGCMVKVTGAFHMGDTL